MEINFQCFQCTLCPSSPSARSSSALAINSQRQQQQQQTSNKILKYECSCKGGCLCPCLCCLPLLGALVVVPPAKNSKIHAHATSSLDTFAMHTSESPPQFSISRTASSWHCPCPAPPPRCSCRVLRLAFAFISLAGYFRMRCAFKSPRVTY